MSGAKAAVMVAGTAASVGIALMHERHAAPTPVEAAPAPPPIPVATMTLASTGPAVGGTISNPFNGITRRVWLAGAIVAGALMFAGLAPALPALASLRSTSSATQASFGPPVELRSSAGVSGNWEQSYSVSAPSASQLGAALLAGVQEQRKFDELRALITLSDQKIAAEKATAAALEAEGGISTPEVAQKHAAGAPFSLNSESGVGAGTVLRARVTIYGCSGPGGGFCNHMASGGTAFEGAAACSTNLPFGTRLTIDGDPTGRVYECLDRGSLAPTWIDVYFENTSDGIAWQSSLGTTLTDIHIVN